MNTTLTTIGSGYLAVCAFLLNLSALGCAGAFLYFAFVGDWITAMIYAGIVIFSRIMANFTTSSRKYFRD